MTALRVAVVILAAGTSSRLGQPKQLLELGGEPLIRHTVRHALASRARDVVLVVGSRASEIAGAVGDLGQRVVHNPDFAAGQSTSMVAGVGSLDPEIDAAIMMLGDQPTVSTVLLDQLIERFEDSRAEIVQPRYLDGPGNPVLFARSLFPELMAVTGDRGAREIIRSHKDAISFMAIDAIIPPDVDSLDDYNALKAMWELR